MNKYKAIMAGVALLAVPAFCSAALVTSFESGGLDGWTAGTVNGSATTVNTDRASDGIYSAGSSFAVSGGGTFALLDRDARGIVDAGTTTLSMDVYSDWTDANSWGIYANAAVLILNYQGGWTTVAPTTGSLVNGSFQTMTYDLTPYAAIISDSGLTYSQLGLGWNLGTWAGDGGGATYTDNGTQTFAIDNIQIIPEPATIGMVAFAGAGVLFIRRRFMM